MNEDEYLSICLKDVFISISFVLFIELIDILVLFHRCFSYIIPSNFLKVRFIDIYVSYKIHLLVELSILCGRLNLGYILVLLSTYLKKVTGSKLHSDQISGTQYIGSGFNRKRVSTGL